VTTCSSRRAREAVNRQARREESWAAVIANLAAPLR
jgi:hypothetical protein